MRDRTARPADAAVDAAGDEPSEEALNPAWIVSPDGADIEDALRDAGYAGRAVRTAGEARRLGREYRSGSAVHPPLIVVDLRAEPDVGVIRDLRRSGRQPVLAVADDLDTAQAAVDAGANDTVGGDELANRLPELANYLLRMATLW